MFILDNIDSVNKKIIELLSNLSLNTINKIPEGFNNNIAWNFGHVATSSYSLAFRVTKVDADFQIPHFDKYKKGSKPEGFVAQEEINELIALADNFTNAIKLASGAHRFEQVAEYTTQTFEVPVTSINDMLTTIAMHNTLHWQIIKDYKRILNHKS